MRGPTRIVVSGAWIVLYVAPSPPHPAGTQKYKLTHRDGNGEIFFGSRLEYHEMQTCITYRHEAGLWQSEIPRFDSQSLPRSVHKLLNKQPLSILASIAHSPGRQRGGCAGVIISHPTVGGCGG